MQKITPSQYNILEALGRYMFLTVDLIDRLQIFKNKVSIYRALKPLKEGKRPLIIAQNFGIHPIKGQIPSLLYLSKYGKSLLSENGIQEYKIKIPLGKTFVSTDYYHRVSNIATFIYMDQYIKSQNGHIVFLDYYFSKSKDKKAKNRIELENGQYIIPDIVTKFSIAQKEYLYLIEVHNGKDSNKAFTQCLQHIKAIDLASPKEKYNHPKNNRVVFIFEYESCLESVLNKMNTTNGLKKYLNLFLFNTIDGIKNDFNHWRKFDSSFCGFI